MNIFVCQIHKFIRNKLFEGWIICTPPCGGIFVHFGDLWPFPCVLLLFGNFRRSILGSMGYNTPVPTGHI